MDIKAYKITDNNGQCNGFQYEINKRYHIDNISICKRGFHACENPIDCMGYKDIFEARFFEVICRGEIIKEKTKLACSDIEIVRELSLKEYIDVCYKHTSSGNYAHHASSGDRSIHVSSGDYSSHVSSGNGSSHASSDNGSIHASSGNFSQHASSGDYSRHASSGDYSRHTSSGNRSQHASSGDYSICCGIGYRSRCMVEKHNSFIMIADYEDGKIKRVVSKKPGQKVDGIEIKTNHWYWFEDGKLMEEKA